jgi:hypothetical protein
MIIIIYILNKAIVHIGIIVKPVSQIGYRLLYNTLKGGKVRQINISKALTNEKYTRKHLNMLLLCIRKNLIIIYST